MTPEITLVMKRTPGQRGNFEMVAEACLSLWYAEAELNNCVRSGDGETEGEARNMAIANVIAARRRWGAKWRQSL